jgi:hypothetical protein
MTRFALVAVVTLIAACNAPSDPALLDHAQILAVRSEPAHVAPGGAVRIDALIGTADGAVAVVVPDRVSVPGFAVEARGDGWYVQSSAALPGAPVAAITVTIDGSAWQATKQLDFQDDRANPATPALQVDGVAAPTVAVPRTARPALDAPVSEADPEPLDYAWYTSIGTLEHYRSAEATLDADETGDGTMVVIARDRAGGVAWQVVAVQIR